MRERIECCVALALARSSECRVVKIQRILRSRLGLQVGLRLRPHVTILWLGQQKPEIVNWLVRWCGRHPPLPIALEVHGIGLLERCDQTAVVLKFERVDSILRLQQRVQKISRGLGIVPKDTFVGEHYQPHLTLIDNFYRTPATALETTGVEIADTLTLASNLYGDFRPIHRTGAWIVFAKRSCSSTGAEVQNMGISRFWKHKGWQQK